MNDRAFVASIEKLAIRNQSFRHVLFTGLHAQLVLMSLGPGEEIGREIHTDCDQFFRIEQGTAKLVLGAHEEHRLEAGDAALVPSGTFHNLINESPSEPLRLYTIYSPPQHAPATIHRTKAEAMAAETV